MLASFCLSTTNVFLYRFRHVIMSMDNTTADYYDVVEETATEMKEPESVRNIAIAMLGFLSVAGIIGNSLVLYVFTRQKQKLSSTIFILTLAGTDLTTSLVTMPYTIALEFVNFNVRYDVVCKIYQFLTTTTIPFSASVMVAIAVDRYLCIVHPFKHTMTIKRAKISVLFLALFSIGLGLPSALMYGIYGNVEMDPSFISDVLRLSEMTINSSLSSETDVYPDTVYHYETPNSNTSGHAYLNVSQEVIYLIRNTGRCHKNGLILGTKFFEVYQKVYSSYYAVCAVIVIILYAAIYRSVLTRRRRRLHLSVAHSCCGFLGTVQAQQQVENNEHEQTECTMLNNIARDKSPSSRGSRKGNEKDKEKEEGRQEILELEDKNGNATAASDANGTPGDREALMRTNGVSRAKLEKLRLANIKTAFCLAIVALTYIVAFLPAWLMALSVIEMNVIVFYLYFTYNVANPIIYAFLNQSFRIHLQTLCKL